MKLTQTQKIEILKWADCGVNIAKYVLEGFTRDQLGVIASGIARGLDVSKYTDPMISAERMAEIQDCLLNGITKISYPTDVLSVLAKAKCYYGIDLTDYADQGFDADQLEAIGYGLSRKLDMSHVIDKRYSGEQMIELLKGPNRERVLDPQLTPDEMYLIMRGYEVSNLPFGSVKELRKVVELGIDAHKYANPDYTYEQTEQICAGLTLGLDVTKYDDPKNTDMTMLWMRMAQSAGVEAKTLAGLKRELAKKYGAEKITDRQWNPISKALNKGFDVTEYVLAGYDFEQLKVIIEGLKHGKDPHKFARLDKSTNWMYIVMNCQELYNCTYSEDVMYEVCEAYKNDIDIASYADAGYDADQLHELWVALDNGVNVPQYASKSYTAEQLHELADGYITLTDPYISAAAMHLINEGYDRDKVLATDDCLASLLCGVNGDVSPYLGQDYTYEQMEEIVTGLNQGVDVSEYADPKYTDQYMKYHRIAQLLGLKLEKYTKTGLLNKLVG